MERWVITIRVLLINTPYPMEEHLVPPLSLSYLAAALQREDIEVEILDLLVTGKSPGKIRKKLEQFQPQFVGANCVTLNYFIAAKNLKVCKDYNPEIITVLGGPHASFALSETLSHAPWIDFLVIGEGERTLVELIRAFERDTGYGQVPGIAFLKEGKVVTTGPPPHLESPDTYSFPARRLLPLSKYRAMETPCTMITSRGCPHRCIFCSGPRLFGRRVRFRDPKLVVDEIEHIQKELGFKKINIVDDTFTFNHRHAREICLEILRRGLDFKWNVFARVDTVNQDLLSTMKEAGCEWLFFGVESASPQILKTIRKGITLDDVLRGVKLTTGAGIKVFNSFILGLPGETSETARQSLDFARELRQEYGAKYGFHLLSPLPGTELYEKPGDYGLRILSRNWARYDANRPITETAHMDVDTAMKFLAEYEESIAGDLNEVQRLAESNDPQSQEELKLWASMDFAWKLIKDDVIENMGRIRGNSNANPVEKLAQKVSQKLTVPLDTACRELELLIDKGLIKNEQLNGSATWKWS